MALLRAVAVGSSAALLSHLVSAQVALVSLSTLHPLPLPTEHAAGEYSQRLRLAVISSEQTPLSLVVLWNANGTTRLPTCPAAIAAVSGAVILLHRESFVLFFFSFVFLAFLQIFELPYAFVFIQWGRPPHDTRACLGWHLRDAAGMPTGLQQQGTLAFQRQTASFARQRCLAQAA